jgi:hypothetical protein
MLVVRRLGRRHATADFDVQVRQEIARDATFAKAEGLKPN